METLLETIRLAVQRDATDEARAAGVLACRTILTALETKPGEPMVVGAAPSIPSAEPAPPGAQLAQVVAALRGMPADQLLDLAIARMRAALPAGTEPQRAEPVKFHIVQLPPGRRT